MKYLRKTASRVPAEYPWAEGAVLGLRECCAGGIPPGLKSPPVLARHFEGSISSWAVLRSLQVRLSSSSTQQPRLRSRGRRRDCQWQKQRYSAEGIRRQNRGFVVVAAMIVAFVEDCSDQHRPPVDLQFPSLWAIAINQGHSFLVLSVNPARLDLASQSLWINLGGGCPVPANGLVKFCLLCSCPGSVSWHRPIRSAV